MLGNSEGQEGNGIVRVQPTLTPASLPILFSNTWGMGHGRPRAEWVVVDSELGTPTSPELSQGSTSMSVLWCTGSPLGYRSAFER